MTISAITLGILVGVVTPDWGHTYMAEGFGKLYAVRSLSEESSLCVLEMPRMISPVMTLDELVIAAEYKTPGKNSCHLTILGAQAVLSDYTSGTLSLFDLDSDGMPSGDPKIVTFEGNGPDPVRQTSPHIHSSWISPDGASILVVDLGCDRIYRFAVNNGKIDVATREDIILPAGCGPRHCAFNREGTRLYVATELSDEVLVYSYPEMKLMQRNLVNETHPRGGSHVVLSPDGQYVYVSSRLKNDGIAVFRVKKNGQLEKCSYCPTGAHPRHFVVSEDGQELICASRDSNSIEYFSLSDGILEKQGEYKIDKPVFVIIK